MPTNTFTGQDTAVDWAVSRRSLGLWLFGAPPLRSRPAADVERSYPVCVRLKTTSDTLEVVEVSAVGLTHQPATWAGLRGIACVDRLHTNTFLNTFVLKGEPQKTVRDAVDNFSASFTPLVLALPQVLKPLDGYFGIKLICQFDQFCRELPTSGSCVVPLSSAELLELLTRLAPAVGISMDLEFCPPSLELRLHSRQILPKIELLQNSALGAKDSHGNAASVDVHPEHVWTWSLYWCVLLQDCEELEVFTHDHGAYDPASSEMNLKPSPSPILSNRQTHSLMVSADAQGRVAPPRGFDAEKASVKSHNYAVDLISLANSPSIASGLTHELSCNVKSLTVFIIGQTVQFYTTLDLASLDQSETRPNHLEEGVIRFSEFRPLNLGQRERVQDETLLHNYRVRFDSMHSSDFQGEKPPKVIYKPYKGPLDASRSPIWINFWALSLQFFIGDRKYSTQFLPQLKQGVSRCFR